MVEPLTIIGTGAAVVGIIESIANALSTLHDLRGRWKQADLTLVNLEVQLLAFKTALGKIEEWLKPNLDEEQDSCHELVLTVGTVIQCCSMLAAMLDVEVLEFSRNADNFLDTQSRVKFLSKNGTLEELQTMVDRQTNALTLLLTACNCKAISDQKAILESSGTRKIVQRVKDDTSSMYVQRSSTSVHSRTSQYTDNLSNFSKSFEFDRILRETKVYEPFVKVTTKMAIETWRRQKKKAASSSTSIRASVEKLRPELFQTSPAQEEGSRKSQAIDNEIQRELRSHRNSCKVLVLGDEDCGQLFLKQMKILHSNGFTTEELQIYKDVVRSNVWYIIQEIVSLVSAFEMDEGTKTLVVFLSQEFAKYPAPDTATFSTAIKALQELWTSKQLRELLQSIAVELHDTAEYFTKELSRIAQEDYIPTSTDILKAKDKRTGIREYKIDHVSHSLNLCDVSGHCRSESKKWIHSFENVTSVIFFVDLSCYDQRSETGNKLQESILNFDSMANSRWFMRSSFTLFLNIGAFPEKLRRSPLSNYFPDYEGEDNTKRALGYISRCFQNVWRRSDLDHRLYIRYGKVGDYSAFRIVYDTIRDAIMYNNMITDGLI